MVYVSADKLGVKNYKDIRFKRICGIEINIFRSIEEQTLDLGKNVTIISGKNGTLKSCILGLLAHPFSSPNGATDAFGINLKTDMRDVFFLSPEKDNRKYRYNMRLETVDGDLISEPVRVYHRGKEDRFRVTVGLKNQSGQGNFSLNTAYINLNRLVPINETDAIRNSNRIDKELSEFVSDGYCRILQKEEFSNPSQVFEKKKKSTFSPSPDASSDYKSISAGEDNIGHILNKMYGFVSNQFDDNSLQGILCIDEIEASLHPVAQRNILQYLMNWSDRYRVQVVVTTHSLFLIQEALRIQSESKTKDSLVINMISTAFVKANHYNIIKNPTYEVAYKELTFDEMSSLEDVYKINLLCEDTVAETYVQRILSSRTLIKKLSFIHNLSSNETGTSFQTFISLMNNGDRLLRNSIVLFDPDVDMARVKNSVKTKKVPFLSLPSIHKVPIEKEIVHYIHDLDGDDPFFRKFNREQAAFNNDFSKYGIIDFSQNAIDDKTNIKQYKKWANSDKNFNRYITYYTKKNPDIIDPFRSELLSIINDMATKSGLPKFVKF